MDEFTIKRHIELSKSFVDIYEEGSPTLAAKLLVEANLKETELEHIRDLISEEFLSRGWTFPGAADAGI